VAPDHPKIKSVTRAYDKTSAYERFRFFGHVELGRDVTREELLERYHVVFYAIGTATDRRLGIPGEELVGSHAATEFVAWYNGRPDHTGLEVDLQATQVVVVGAGNVAIDVVRMLALALDELAVTDCADHAIKVLNTSGIEEITILARRAPLHAAFTNPELFEMGELERADVEVVNGELDPLSAAALADADKTRTRNVEITADYAARARTGKPLVVRFRYLAAPLELLGDGHGHVRAVRIENNEIVQRGWVADRARHRRDRGAAGAAGVPVDRLPRRAAGGRPVRRAPRADPQRRRPRDRRRRQAMPGRIRVRLDQAGPVGHAIDWSGWEAIDAAETAAGAASSPARPRVKLAE
jgi:ferredoxin--NADP+ reductase